MTAQDRTEFGLIARYFSAIGERHHQCLNGGLSLRVGVGDDAAILKTCGPPEPEAHQHAFLGAAISSVIQGPDGAADATRLFSDSLYQLAAERRKPSFASLALSLKELREPWLERFANRLNELFERFEIPLVGGDTTGGVDRVSLFLHGTQPVCEPSQQNTRSSAQFVAVRCRFSCAIGPGPRGDERAVSVAHILANRAAIHLARILPQPGYG